MHCGAPINYRRLQGIACSAASTAKVVYDRTISCGKRGAWVSLVSATTHLYLGDRHSNEGLSSRNSASDDLQYNGCRL